MAQTQSEVLQNHLEKFDKNLQIKTENGQTNNKRKSLNEKVFKAQNSLLTDLFQIPHIKTIYNIFVTGLMIFFIQAVISDVINTGRINLGFERIKWNFGKMPYALLIWTVMMISLHILYLAYTFWALQRINLPPKVAQIWDKMFLIGYILFGIMLFVIPAREAFITRFPTTTALALLSEQMRLMMKSYAFVRSNLSRVVNIKAKTEDATNELNIPTYKNFIYFLFAPTLIYRDSYPRTDRINWKFVTMRLLEVVGIIFYINFLFENSLIPLYKDFGKKSMPLDQLVKSIFSSMTPAIVIFLCGFYVLLHAWLNAMAELLRFADRGFYKEWWLSTHYAEYYSKWNCVVHDWLFAYVYKELDGFLGSQKRYFSLFGVFLISALFHEYVLALSFGFFYPFLFMVFGFFGVSLVFLPRKAGGNIFLWLLLYSGVGVLTSVYLIEYYARINCPPITDSALLDFFLPRSWWCKIN